MDGIPFLSVILTFVQERGEISSCIVQIAKMAEEIGYKDINSVESLKPGDKVYINYDFDIDAWYKKQAKTLFLERLNYNYEKFSRKIPYPNLRIRKMKTRWVQQLI